LSKDLPLRVSTGISPVSSLKDTAIFLNKASKVNREFKDFLKDSGNKREK